MEIAGRCLHGNQEKKNKQKPKITLIARSPKAFLKCHRLEILDNDIGRQLSLNEDIIKETLLEDLIILKGLQLNTVFNLILQKVQNRKPMTLPDDFSYHQNVILFVMKVMLKLLVQVKNI